ncbi:putative proteasome endopeptidase complex [Rosa chinensis]|uniref:Putative proteasome endopeptidase complex n=1 Tax=Rosa chinensis TaxID=74649 RepID=A0A2P6RXD7_ROSCH|nr:putative proteasome endopeptidase complex [Rosa chinensis]
MFKHKLYQLREERDMKPETFARLVSAIIYYLREKAKAMAGDTVVRSLLEKMAECASNTYLGILVRYSSRLMSTILCLMRFCIEAMGNCARGRHVSDPN